MNFTEYIQSPIAKEIIYNELEHSFIYFKNLNAPLKQRFVERTSTFIEQKKFVARQHLDMTDTIRIIISACAVQVTFGLDTFTLDTFEYVVIYPDVYESPVTKQMHKGETNLSGFICLSWKDVLAGLENPHDNYNLGIHEWTHALRFNGINYDQTDYFFDGYINKWVASAMHEFYILKNEKTSIFRRYGAANIHEFLSVCTEHFFESPDEFKLKAPELFEQMCILLNQVPGNDRSSQIGVRNALLGASDFFANKQESSLLTMEASFFRTVLNMGSGLLYFGMALVMLLMQNNGLTMILAGMVCIAAVVIMNNKYFTIKFYENNIYLQSGFIASFANKFSISYRSLIKMEIYEGNFDTSSGTVFQLKYYNGSKFLKKTVYCSSIDVPCEKIVSLLQEKKVRVLFPN
ncbi:MAG: zinc-dependent peptidase [Bacteroidota bacterium]